MTLMSLEPWDIRDPALLITELDQRHPFRPGRVIVGLVEHPTTLQHLVASRTVWDDEQPPPDYHELNDLLRDTAIELFGDRDPRRRTPVIHTWITAICRPGRVVWGPLEHLWFLGWRYSNHLLPTFVSDTVTVTEHGWRMHGDDIAGTTPALHLAASSDGVR